MLDNMSVKILSALLEHQDCAINFYHVQAFVGCLNNVTAVMEVLQQLERDGFIAKGEAGYCATVAGTRAYDEHKKAKSQACWTNCGIVGGIIAAVIAIAQFLFK